MNYSNMANSCRVDLWKDTGVWHDTIGVHFAKEDFTGDLHTAYMRALVRVLKKDDGSMICAGMRATCLEPYHQHAHPISLVIPERASDWAPLV